MRSTMQWMGVVFAMSLWGCSRHEETVQPVSWYEEHPSDMQTKMAWCVDDAARGRTADCQNAAEARRRTLVGLQSTLAPIDWNAKPKP